MTARTAPPAAAIVAMMTVLSVFRTWDTPPAGVNPRRILIDCQYFTVDSGHVRHEYPRQTRPVDVAGGKHASSRSRRRRRVRVGSRAAQPVSAHARPRQGCDLFDHLSGRPRGNRAARAEVRFQLATELQARRAEVHDE